MPFTIVHPIAVLPLKRLRLPFSALVIGSITPDLEYIIHRAPISYVSHTLFGLVSFCLPAGLLLLWIYHRLWKPPLLSYVSISQDTDKNQFHFLPSSRFFMLCLAILIGALTHLFWDSFTHQYGWMVRHLPILTTVVFHTNWGTISLYKTLQQISTIFGLIILAILGISHRQYFKVIKPILWKITVLISFTSAAITLTYCCIQLALPSNIKSLIQFMVVYIVIFFGVAIAEVTILSLVWHGYYKGYKPVFLYRK
ncbi:MAG: DUF4184 family protein [bacterium]